MRQNEIGQSISRIMADRKAERVHDAWLLPGGTPVQQSRPGKKSTLSRKFFENWKAQLKWQRLEPFEKFAALIDRHWDGLVASCRPENNGWNALLDRTAWRAPIWLEDPLA
jgi:hypothetical protein